VAKFLLTFSWDSFKIGLLTFHYPVNGITISGGSHLGAIMRFIKAVNTNSGVKKFINLPYHLYKNNSTWIPPLKAEQKKIFRPHTNVFLKHCDYQLFLLYEDHRIIGRIAAFVDHRAVDYWQTKTGLFGYYECINDQDAAFMLLNTAQKWLKDHGMQSMRGQWNFVSQDMGFVYEGFDIPPTILSSHYFPYYNDQMTAYGMTKAQDLLVYSCDAGKGYKVPARYLKFSEAAIRNCGVTIRQINMNNLVEDVRLIVRLTNESLKNNWGFYPVDENEATQMAADMKRILFPELILFAEIDGQPIGYIIALPDINHLLNNLHGKLFPFGFFKLLWGIKRLNRFRLWALGILPPYQQKGVSVLLFQRINEILAPKGSYVEANWVLESNTLMNNTLIKLKAELIKKYRIYEKPIT
jgi:GNAT superfamily N-acetyltransferase